MKKTIAFDHENNFWTTRYSYVTSCIGWIKKLFVSAPIEVTNQKVFWKHDDTATTNNVFYGATAVPSSISVTFNQDPSSMKIFKAMSIETTDFRTLAGASNNFVTNNGTGNSNTQSVSMKQMNEHGGVLYGHIPFDSATTSASFEYLGVAGIKSEASASLKSKYGITTVAILIPLYDRNGSAVPQGSYLVSDTKQYKDNGTGATAYYFSLFKVVDEGVIVYTEDETDLLADLLAATTSVDAGKALHLVSTTNMNSDQARGFYAEADISLGSNDFELFSINLDYETNPLGPTG
jgi:hypothetical protein